MCHMLRCNSSKHKQVYNRLDERHSMFMDLRHDGCRETEYHWNRNVLAGDEAEKGKIVSEKILKAMRKVAWRLQDSRPF